MIARYPKFSKLDIAHRSEIEALISRFDPYSDFIFISLFCWNTDESAEVALLNDNLVIKMPDYLSGRPVYSLLGDRKIDESLQTLLGSVDELKLVPEVVIENIKQPKKFDVAEDPDNHDYIYRVDEHAGMSGAKLKGKRRKAKRFERTFEGRFFVEKVDLSNRAMADKVREIFESWAKASSKTDEAELKHEREAIERLLKNAPHFDTIALMIAVDEKPAGFSIHELFGKNYAVCQFHKSVPHFGNIDVYLTSAAANDLKKRGPTFVNWYQDLGLSGLKRSKESYYPAKKLKKYIVKLKN